MGRKKLHRSKEEIAKLQEDKEELAEDNRQRQRKFYEKNKDKLNAARMERYYKSVGKSDE